MSLFQGMDSSCPCGFGGLWCTRLHRAARFLGCPYHPAPRHRGQGLLQPPSRPLPPPWMCFLGSPSRVRGFPSGVDPFQTIRQRKVPPAGLGFLLCLGFRRKGDSNANPVYQNQIPLDTSPSLQRLLQPSHRICQADSLLIIAVLQGQGWGNYYNQNTRQAEEPLDGHILARVKVMSVRAFGLGFRATSAPQKQAG